MNVLYPTGSRNEFLDRNPAAVNLLYQAFVVTPTGETTRATYTVPANRRAIMTFFHASILRVNVATTAGDVWLALRQTIAAVDYIMAMGQFNENVVGKWYHFHQNLDCYLFPGDVIKLTEQDASTGGNCTFHGTAKFIEFDA